MKKILALVVIIVLGTVGWFYFQPTTSNTIPVQKVQEQFYITGKVDILPDDIKIGDTYGHIIARKNPQYASKHPYDGAWWHTIRAAESQHGFLRADLKQKITIYLYE